MSITFLCPSGHRLCAPEEQAETAVTCPICGHGTIVPRKSDCLAAASSSGVPAVEAMLGAAASPQPAAERRSEPVGPPPLPEQPEVVEPGKSEARVEDPAAPLAAKGLNGNGQRIGPRHAPPPLPVQRAARSPSRPRWARAWFDLVRPSADHSASDAYSPEQGKVQGVWWLAASLGLAVLFSAAPALAHRDLQLAPGWARAVLLIAVLQWFYIAWMAATPDWSTVRIVMMVFAGVSALYAVATAYALATPLDSPMPLGMGAIRSSLARWCGAVLLVMTLATYFCGRFSANWQRQWRLQAARNGRVLSS
ncbi:MAG: hypothetical protein HUU20_23335 [Pirellulales bacterium]|nr:hypothetical protein [Pirellulales bacterium]